MKVYINYKNLIYFIIFKITTNDKYNNQNSLMNSISKSFIKRTLKTVEQIYLIGDPITLKKEKNKIFN